MFYVILEKNLSNDHVSVAGVFEDEALANEVMSEMIVENEGFGYRMDVVGSQ